MISIAGPALGSTERCTARDAEFQRMGDRAAVPHLTRGVLVDAIMTFLGGDAVPGLQGVRAALDVEVRQAGRAGIVSLNERLNADDGWAYYPPDPLARRIHHLLADRVLRRDSALVGVEHIAAVGSHPVVIFSNHLSYSDANLLEILLRRGGAAGLADRLTAIAGPKVFTSRQRRFSSLCFGTIKVPQSADVSSEEAVLNAREVARAAQRAIGVARDRLAAGDALLIFGEGTRSRTGEMHPFLPAVARYLEVPGIHVLPVGITGTETLFPIGDEAVHPARVVVCAGRPVDVATLVACAGGDRRVIVDALGLAVAGLLPPGYRGAYSDADRLPQARRALAESL